MADFRPSSPSVTDSICVRTCTPPAKLCAESLRMQYDAYDGAVGRPVTAMGSLVYGNETTLALRKAV